MRKKTGDLKIEISAGALIILAIFLLVLPLQWVIAAILAAVIHELCHTLVTLLSGGNLTSIYIGGRGTVITATGLSVKREIVASLAGPLGSLCLLFLARWMPRTAICGCVHGIYNLIPLLPFDGGRILRNVLIALLSPPNAYRVFQFTQRIILILVGILCCVIAGKIGIIVLAIPTFILWQNRRQILLAKIPF